MRTKLFLLMLVSTSSMAFAEPTPKEQLLQPPATARHYTISSTAGKHGDIWSWKTEDGKLAYRMSMSLRGWITETDQTTQLGPDGRPVAIAVRGYTDSGDATEDFSVDANGIARWKTAVDEGSAPFGDKRYSAYGGPFLAGDIEIEALVAAGDKGIDLLPGGRASISIGKATEIDGPAG
nr:amidohydrolase [Sphingorhabdus sp.]